MINIAFKTKNALPQRALLGGRYVTGAYFLAVYLSWINLVTRMREGFARFINSASVCRRSVVQVFSESANRFSTVLPISSSKVDSHAQSSAPSTFCVGGTMMGLRYAFDIAEKCCHV